MIKLLFALFLFSAKCFCLEILISDSMLTSNIRVSNASTVGSGDSILLLKNSNISIITIDSLKQSIGVFDGIQDSLNARQDTLYRNGFSSGDTTIFPFVGIGYPGEPINLNPSELKYIFSPRTMSLWCGNDIIFYDDMDGLNRQYPSVSFQQKDIADVVRMWYDSGYFRIAFSDTSNIGEGHGNDDIAFKINRDSAIINGMNFDIDTFSAYCSLYSATSYISRVLTFFKRTPITVRISMPEINGTVTSDAAYIRCNPYIYESINNLSQPFFSIFVFDDGVDKHGSLYVDNGLFVVYAGVPGINPVSGSFTIRSFDIEYRRK